MALEATGFREELKEIILLSSHVLAGTLLSTFTLSLKTCSTREDTQASQDDSRYSLVRSRSIAASTISKKRRFSNNMTRDKPAVDDFMTVRTRIAASVHHLPDPPASPGQSSAVNGC